MTRALLSVSALCLIAALGRAPWDPSGSQARAAQVGTAGAGGCFVTKDDGTTFTDTSVSACQDYYPDAHACHAPVRPSVCALQDRIKAVDIQGVDMIVNAHRGVWGLQLNDGNAATNPNYASGTATLGGPPENSFEGVEAAAASGFQTVEFDVFMVREDVLTQPTGPGEVFISHFTDYAGFTDYKGEQVIPRTNIAGAKGFLMTTPAADVSAVRQYHLRDRDGRVTTSTLYSLRDFVANARGLQGRPMLIVLDVKFAKSLGQLWRQEADASSSPAFASRVIGFDQAYPAAAGSSVYVCKSGGHSIVNGSSEEQTLATVAEINSELKPSASGGEDLRPYVIIKFPQNTVPCPASLKTRLGDDFDKLQFAPNPDSKPPKDIVTAVSEISYVTDYIAEWMRIGPKAVAFWDTSIPSTANWQGKQFTAPSLAGSTGTYKDLMDFLLRETGRRSAIWNIDPSGPGGRHGNYGMAWDQHPNSATDQRGDQHANLVFSGAKHALVTTDRPDIYLTLRNYLKGLQ